MSNTLSSTSDAMDDVLPTNRHSGEVAAIDTPTPTTLEIVCLVLGEEAPFIVTIARNQRVDDLKKAIYKEMQSPPSINPRFLALYLLNLPDDDGLLKAVGDMRPNTKPPLKATKRLSQVFPAVLKDDTVHILVRPPELAPVSHAMVKDGSGPSSGASGSKHSHSGDIDMGMVGNNGGGSPPPAGLHQYIKRERTVAALYERLKEHKRVLVRGTPASGKSILAQLLHSYICARHEDAQVYIVNGWPEEDHALNHPRSDQERYRALIGIWPVPDGAFVIFDEAQLSYWDERFWRNVIKQVTPFVSWHLIMFASYGSAGAGVIGYGTPINFSDEQRVGLRPSLGVGILLTREEFDELVPHFFNNHRFDVSVLNYVFEMTAGHIGACLDFLLLIQRENSYRSMRPPQQYTRDMFILNVDPNEFFRSLLNSTIFSRGFPSKVDLGDPSYANGLRLVLNESHRCKITNPREPLHPDINVCHQKGWLYSETVDNNIIYRFASPLHERQAEWLLLAPAGGTIGQATLREFVIAAIKGFNPLNLQERNDLGVTQRIPEAQYQQEFYRATFALTHACVMMFSEFGNGFGRVNFYIRSKKWVIEFLRDRDRLPEHQERFLSGEYANWISTNAIDDYIIIDCRSISNQRPKPAYKNLICVIFTDDYTSVEIQDNNNKLLDQFNLMFGSGL